MTCQDLARDLGPYLDGELAAEEQVEVALHLQGCPACRAAATREDAALKAFRVAAPRHAPDPAFVARMQARFGPQPSPQADSLRGLRRLFHGGLALAVALSLVVALQYRERSLERDVALSLAAEAIATHAAQPHLGAAGTAEEVRAWLAEAAPFEVELPFAAEVELVGAGLTEVGGREAVLLRYRAGEAPLTVLQVSRGQGMEPVASRPRRFVDGRVEALLLEGRGVLTSVVRDAASDASVPLWPASWQP